MGKENVNDVLFRIMFSGCGLGLGLVGVITMLVMPWAFRFDKDEIHHFYGGWLMTIVAPIHLTVWPDWVVWTVYGLGFWLMADDWYQHYRQVKDPEYRSLWHRILWRLWLVF